MSGNHYRTLKTSNARGSKSAGSKSSGGLSVLGSKSPSISTFIGKKKIYKEKADFVNNWS